MFKWPDTTSIKASMIAEMRFAFTTFKKWRRQCGFLITSFNYDAIKKEVSIVFVSGYEFVIQDIDLVFLPKNGNTMTVMTKKDDLCLIEVKFKES